MGKLAVVGTTVVVGGGTAVGGVVLSKMFSFDSTLPTTVDAFKGQKGEEIEGCVQSLFPDLKEMDESSAGTPSKDEIKDSFLDTNKKEQVAGCLVVNWDKEEYGKDSSKNGKGKFRLLWAVQQENKGFVVFTTADTTNDTEKKLLGKGVAYSLEKKENEGGKLSKKKEVDINGKKIGKDDVETKFPKADTPLTSLPFGGLMTDKNGVETICGSSDCQDSSSKALTFFEGYWQWRGASSGKNLGDGTSNLSEGWKELFGDSEWKMSKVVENMTGNWENKVGHGIDRPEK